MVLLNEYVSVHIANLETLTALAMHKTGTGWHLNTLNNNAISN